MGYGENDPLKPIQDAVTALRDALSKYLDAHESRLKIETGNIHARVKQRQVEARQLNLDNVLTEIYEEVKSYPTLIKRDDWERWWICKIENVCGDKEDQERRVFFTLNANEYRLTYRDPGLRYSGSDDESFHHTTLSLSEATGGLLMEVNISVEYDYSTVLRPFGVSAFVPGPWMQDFLECYERFKAEKRRREIENEYESEKVSELKKRYGLD